MIKLLKGFISSRHLKRFMVSRLIIKRFMISRFMINRFMIKRSMINRSLINRFILFSACLLGLSYLCKASISVSGNSSKHVLDSARYPQHYFSLPLAIPIQVKANFAEFRGDHFHSGLDLGTNGKEGSSVLSVADGYVSRIKVQAGGYGQALYITHPNGYVSVYGHLKSYTGKIGTWLEQFQYANKTYELDVYPKPGDLPVTKGMQVALSGNTGYSGGPHLHFEIRDEKTEEIINPILFGFQIPDHTPPVIQGITIFSITRRAALTDIYPVAFIAAKQISLGHYSLDKKIPSNLPQEFIIGITCDDAYDGNPSRHVIYKIRLSKDSNVVFESVFERFAFDQTRSINSYLDYPLSERKKKIFVQRSYKEPGNEVSLYAEVKKAGILEASHNLPQKMSYQVYDAMGNMSTLNFMINGTNEPEIANSQAISQKNNRLNNGLNSGQRETSLKKNIVLYNVKSVLDFNASGSLVKSNDAALELQFPSKSLFDNMEISAVCTQGIWHIGDTEKAVRDSVLTVFHINDSVNSDKLVITHVDGLPLKTFIDGGRVCAWIKSFGSYELKYDTEPPSVTIKNIPEKGRPSVIRLIIKDTGSGIRKYEGLIDGNWVLFRYDQKSNALWYPFDHFLYSGRHLLQVHVTDGVGNEKLLETYFTN